MLFCLCSHINDNYGTLIKKACNPVISLYRKRNCAKNSIFVLVRAFFSTLDTIKHPWFSRRTNTLISLPFPSLCFCLCLFSTAPFLYSINKKKKKQKQCQSLCTAHGTRIEKFEHSFIFRYALHFVNISESKICSNEK